MTARRGESTRHRSRAQFAELLKVQGKLALREPFALVGLALPAGLLALFGWIGQQNPDPLATPA